MSSRLRTALGSAVTAAAVLATAACGGASSSAGAPPSTALPHRDHDAVPLDPHRVARATSRSGPVWFRSDLAYEADLAHPLLRTEGIVDWTTSRASATESEDPAQVGSGSAHGLRPFAKLWITRDLALESDLDAGRPSTPSQVSTSLVDVVGLNDSPTATSSSRAAMERALRDLFDSQTFGSGVPESLDGVDVLHYEGRARTADSGSVEIWVSEDGLLAQVLTHASESYNPVVVVTRFSDYRTDGAIEPAP